MMTALDKDTPDALGLLLTKIKQIPDYHLYGRVTAVQGMLVEVGGVQRRLSIGDRCQIAARGGRQLTCEVVGFRDGRALLMPFGALEGIGLGCKADVVETEPVIRRSDRCWRRSSRMPACS